MQISRRAALKSAPGLAAARLTAGQPPAPRLRFGVVGIRHGHIVGMSDGVILGGGELVAFHSSEPALAADERAILEDPSIQLVPSSIVPVQRAPLGIRVMRHGKDSMAGKPGVTTLAQLAEVRRVQAVTRRARRRR